MERAAVRGFSAYAMRSMRHEPCFASKQTVASTSEYLNTFPAKVLHLSLELQTLTLRSPLVLVYNVADCTYADFRSSNVPSTESQPEIEVSAVTIPAVSVSAEGCG